MIIIDLLLLSIQSRNRELCLLPTVWLLIQGKMGKEGLPVPGVKEEGRDLLPKGPASGEGCLCARSIQDWLRGTERGAVSETRSPGHTSREGDCGIRVRKDWL